MNTQDYRELVAQVAYEQAKTSTSAFFFDGQDRLRIRSFGSLGSVTVSLEGRFLGADGRVQAIQRDHTPNSDRSAATQLFDLGEGFLLNLRPRASGGTPKVGQVYVFLEVVRGTDNTVQPLATLWAGYVTDTTALGFPTSDPIRSVDGCGVLRSVTGTNPAAGVEITETVPTNARWRLQMFSVVLVTSATVANRSPGLIIDDGATTMFASDPGAVVPASQTQVFTAGNASQRLPVVALVQSWALPSECVLMAGARIRTSTLLLQAGDDWAAPQMLVEEWIED